MSNFFCATNCRIGPLVWMTRRLILALMKLCYKQVMITHMTATAPSLALSLLLSGQQALHACRPNPHPLQLSASVPCSMRLLLSLQSKLFSWVPVAILGLLLVEEDS